MAGSQGCSQVYDRQPVTHNSLHLRCRQTDGRPTAQRDQLLVQAVAVQRGGQSAACRVALVITGLRLGACSLFVQAAAWQRQSPRKAPGQRLAALKPA